MELAGILAIADLASSILAKVAPRIEEAFRKGEISPELEQQHRTAFDMLRAKGFKFTRPDGSGSPS